MHIALHILRLIMKNAHVLQLAGTQKTHKAEYRHENHKAFFLHKTCHPHLIKQETKPRFTIDKCADMNQQTFLLVHLSF